MSLTVAQTPFFLYKNVHIIFILRSKLVFIDNFRKKLRFHSAILSRHIVRTKIIVILG